METKTTAANHGGTGGYLDQFRSSRKAKAVSAKTPVRHEMADPSRAPPFTTPDLPAIRGAIPAAAGSSRIVIHSTDAALLLGAAPGVAAIRREEVTQDGSEDVSVEVNAEVLRKMAEKSTHIDFLTKPPPVPVSEASETETKETQEEAGVLRMADLELPQIHQEPPIVQESSQLPPIAVKKKGGNGRGYVPYTLEDFRKLKTEDPRARGRSLNRRDLESDQFLERVSQFFPMPSNIRSSHWALNKRND